MVFMEGKKQHDQRGESEKQECSYLAQRILGLGSRVCLHARVSERSHHTECARVRPATGYAKGAQNEGRWRRARSAEQSCRRLLALLPLSLGTVVGSLLL